MSIGMGTSSREIRTAKVRVELDLDVMYRRPESMTEEYFIESLKNDLKMRIDRKGLTATNIKIEKYDKEQQL